MLNLGTSHVWLSAGLVAASLILPVAAGQDLSSQPNAVILQPGPLQSAVDPTAGATITVPAFEQTAATGILQDPPGTAREVEAGDSAGTTAEAKAELSVNVSAEPVDSAENLQETTEPSAQLAVTDSVAPLLLQEALAPSPGGADPAAADQRLPLLLVIERAATGQRLPAVQSYWRLSIAQAELFYAEQQLALIGGMTEPTELHSAALLASAHAQATARRERASLELVEAQTRLAEIAALPVLGQLPLTQDAPFVGRYRTQFESLVLTRSLPLTLHRIHRMLPHQLALLQAQAQSVRATQHAVESLSARYAVGGIGIEALLGVMQQLSEQQQHFLTTVRSYNELIAEYALGVAGPGLAASTITRMLVKTDTTASAPERSIVASDGSSVQRASATAPAPPEAVRIPAGWEPR